MPPNSPTVPQPMKCDCVVMRAGVITVAYKECCFFLNHSAPAYKTILCIMLSYYPPQPLMFRVQPLLFFKTYRNTPGGGDHPSISDVLS